MNQWCMNTATLKGAEDGRFGQEREVWVRVVENKSERRS
jgi:hypothetical protein